MKILFLNPGCSSALHRELRLLGHVVEAPERLDWYRACRNLSTVQDFQDQCLRYVDGQHADAIILHKGWHWWRNIDTYWALESTFLEQLPAVRKLYLCWDDPAAAPVTLGLDIPRHFDAWLTSCPGIVDLLDVPIPVHEFWQAWDASTVIRTVPHRTCDLAITGQPYGQAFPAPHHQPDLSSMSREELAVAAIRAGHHVAIWGPAEWLQTAARAAYHCPLPRSSIDEVHAAARLVLGHRFVDGRRCANARIFQVLGAGGAALLHADCPDLHDEFSGAVAWFSTPDDMLRKMELLLSDEPTRLAQVRRGREVIAARHLWKHRAARLSTILQELP